MEYVIPGPPIPLHRARASKHGFYDSQYQAKKNIKWYFSKTYSEVELHNCPISITITFHMPIPKSTSKKKYAKLLSSPHIKIPDIDNNLKFIFDTFNGILWEDDSLIYEVHAKKVYSENPRTVFKIAKYEEPNEKST